MGVGEKGLDRVVGDVLKQEIITNAFNNVLSSIYSYTD